ERVGRPDRGVKQAGFLVSSYTTMASVLIELGFLTNANEEDFLQGEQGQDYMASAIYRAFKEYKATVEGVELTAPAPVVEKPAPPVPEPATSGVRFKVQVVTSSKRIEPTAKNFKGLDGVEEHRGNELYRYTVGDEPTLERARTVQKLCREKGYDGAFIVAFRDGVRIDLQEAVKFAQSQ
ncbi:MAG TPA: N-acetylmuramoyl-L-alanine amidase, partial [Flavobacteriales bacterium]|nr:N-acetylmuramoyl-L-alanine amidase [Flavobacteriales bacterium]